jgi:hypothetical protein
MLFFSLVSTSLNNSSPFIQAGLPTVELAFHEKLTWLPVLAVAA